ncbi:ABC transporter permease [Acinetobacter bouvetii]|uniref:Inner membrane transport permease YbhS n=1 Tax=Acinetobacter bouvetii TaxID=202951 RepID=A0A811GIF0_9GAMM|nr:ABC transporter permease [Acinetobacter bouvetii]CAB1221721.1 Inner membrane transport permease YbhS [Acinetobacter bouvetii]
MKHSNAFFVRLWALLKKETRQLVRDKSSLAIGLLLPIILILLFGYGLSFDLSNGRVGVVVEQSTQQSSQIISGLEGSRYLTTQQYQSYQAAEHAIQNAEIDAILHIPATFAEDAANGQAHLQLLLNGRSTSIAAAMQAYVSVAINTAAAIQADRQNIRASTAMITVEQRMWFNESANSTWYLVPGLIVLILTLIGAFLTGLLIARERERGTLEALFVTPIRPIEMVIAKLTPYLVIGMIDIGMCLIASYFLFEVPMRGSIISIVSAAFLYLLVSLLLGLTISGFAQSQFQASQIALLTSFMPAMMLSGFVFDTRNLPLLVQLISQIIPATHFMILIKTLFLGGDDWSLWLKECSILMIYIVVLMFASCKSLKKQLR